ncbi:MAG: enolase C-terminal domain-like protein, partial [Candidatus Bathyarchaeia archaeon]
HFEKEAFAWVQPDVGNVGGILETLRIAAMADSYFLPIAPHNPNGPVLSSATAHLGAAIPNFRILEFCTYHETHRDPSWLWEVVDYSYEKQYMERKDGYIEVSNRPGLGLELKEDIAEKHVNIREIKV